LITAETSSSSIYDGKGDKHQIILSDVPENDDEDEDIGDFLVISG